MNALTQYKELEVDTYSNVEGEIYCGGDAAGAKITVIVKIIYRQAFAHSGRIKAAMPKPANVQLTITSAAMTRLYVSGKCNQFHK